MSNLIPVNTTIPPTISPASNDVKQYVIDNLEDICKSNSCKENTQRKYLEESRAFLTWLSDKPFTIQVLLEFRNVYLAKERTDIRVGTKNMKLAAIRNICNELFFREQIPIKISERIKNFKDSQGHKKEGFNPEEVAAIEKYIEAIEDDMQKARLNCMFSLLLRQGLRQFEMCNLMVSDYLKGDVKILVRGKGMDEKDPIDLHPKTAKAIDDYLDISNKKSGYIFTSEGGKQKGEKLSERGFRFIFDTMYDKLGIDKSSHGFRHYFVTKMLEATNGNIGIVKQFSRHKSTAALEMYDDRKKKKEHNKIFYDAF